MPKYTIKPEGARWFIYRTIPLGLYSSGQMYVTSFATRAEAEAWCGVREPVLAWQRELEADKYRPENR